MLRASVVVLTSIRTYVCVRSVCAWCCRYKFLAHPTGFIVHRQHSRSNADKMYQVQKRSYEKDMEAGKITKDRPNNNLAGLTHRFRDKVQAEVAAGNYTSLVDDGILNCVKTLPWWQESDALKERRQRRRALLLWGWLRRLL